MIRGARARRCCARRGCRVRFAPRRLNHRHCSKRCGALAVAQRQAATGHRPRLKAALAARAKVSRKRVEAEVGRKYGELSVREIELFNWGRRVGYDQGYNRGYHRGRCLDAA